MTKEKVDPIFDLIDALADEAFEADIATLEAELAEEGRSSADVIASMRSSIGKARLQIAKAARTEPKAYVSNVISLDAAAAKAKLSKIMAERPQLSMAARKGTDVSAADALSTLNDMLRLGLITEDDLR